MEAGMLELHRGPLLVMWTAPASHLGPPVPFTTSNLELPVVELACYRPLEAAYRDETNGCYVTRSSESILGGSPVVPSPCGCPLL